MTFLHSFWIWVAAGWWAAAIIYAVLRLPGAAHVAVIAAAATVVAGAYNGRVILRWAAVIRAVAGRRRKGERQ